MDSDRKYRQHGYNDSGSHSNGHGNGNDTGQKPNPSGPRPPLNTTGPRLPRLVQSVAAARCYSCAATLPPGTEFNGTCPKCGAQLHCCKQCVHFESSMRFQCTKLIPVRIVIKDRLNDCSLFAPRVTVAREGSGSNAGRSPIPGVNSPAPRNAMDARDAFDRLFKK